MSNYLGDFPVDATVYVPFHTFNSSGASVTLTGLAVTDIEIYKDGSTTQRSSDAGYTLLDTDGIDFDGITGIHGFKVDLSDDTDAGFYAAGHEYMVVVSAVTVDSQTVNFVAAEFSIERSGGALALLKSATYGLSAIETLVDDLESRLTATRAGYLDNLSGGAVALASGVNVTQIGGAAQSATDLKDFADTGYDPSSHKVQGVVTVDTTTTATTATNLTNLPAVTTDWLTAAGVKADAVTKIQTGLATPTNITAGTITTVTNLTNAPSNGDFTSTMKTSLNAATPAVTITDSSSDAVIADAVWNAATASYGTSNTYGALIESGNVGGGAIVAASVTGAVGSVTGAVGSVTGAVGSVTGNVGGNVTGSVGSLATQAKADVNAEVDSALSDIHLDHLLATDYDPASKPGVATALLNELVESDGGVSRFTANALEQAPSGSLSAADIADAVWDEASTGHTDAGKAGAQLWTDVDAILEDTSTTLDDKIDAIDDYIDTEVAAIKAKTDLITTSTTINVTGAVSGSTITIWRGDTLSADIDDLGSVADYVSLDFTVKANLHEEDTEALLRIRKNASGTADGLLVLNGATAADSTKGSITIDDGALGDITIALNASVSDDLATGSYVYDIQKISSTTVKTLTTGSLVVTGDITRAVS